MLILCPPHKCALINYTTNLIKNALRLSSKKQTDRTKKLSKSKSYKLQLKLDNVLNQYLPLVSFSFEIGSLFFHNEIGQKVSLEF